MYSLFDPSSTYIFPNGTSSLGSEFSEEYELLKIKDCVLDIQDGVFSSYQPLSQFASQYGIDYSTDDDQDPQEVLDKVLEKKKFIEENPPLTVSDTVLKAASFAALSFTDEQALEVPDLYPIYEVDHAYKKNERFTYKGRLFKVNQDHTSAEQWVPGATGTESLYTAITLNEEGYPVWQQPTGAHDAYNTGDIVEYKAKLYKSKIDGNSWAPDVYPAGWELYTE